MVVYCFNNISKTLVLLGGCNADVCFKMGVSIILLEPTNLGALSFRLRNLMSLCHVTSRDLESEILLYDYIFTSDY